jgi:peptide/nickel transport system substrate-binding protein
MPDGPASQPSRRAFLRATGGVATATALAGCASPLDPEPTEDSPGSTTDGEAKSATDDQATTSSPNVDRALRVASEKPATLDPIAATDDVSTQIVSQLYEPLLSHPDGRLGVEPALAASVSVSDDHETYEFVLRDDATFHDGTPGTAEDVVYSFERAVASEHAEHAHLLLATGANLSYRTTERGEYVQGGLGVTVVDERTVRLRVVKPYAWTLDVLALPALAVVPRGTAGDVDAMPAGGLDDDETQPDDDETQPDDDETQPDDDDGRDYGSFAASEPVGTGPFALESRNADELRLSRFDDYHVTPATVAGIQYRTFADATAAYEHASSTPNDDGPDVFPITQDAFESAELDTDPPDADGRVTGTDDPPSIAETFQYDAAPALHTEVLCPNAERISRPVRRALADVLRQRTLANDAFEGRTKPAVHLTPPALYPGNAAAYREHADAYPYGVGESRVADARDRIDAAGFDDDSPATVTLALPTDSDQEFLAAHLPAAVEPVPIVLETLSLERSEFEDDARKGRLEAWPRELGESTHRGYGEEARIPGLFAGAFLGPVVPE